MKLKVTALTIRLQGPADAYPAAWVSGWLGSRVGMRKPTRKMLVMTHRRRIRMTNTRIGGREEEYEGDDEGKL